MTCTNIKPPSIDDRIKAAISEAGLTNDTMLEFKKKVNIIHSRCTVSLQDISDNINVFVKCFNNVENNEFKYLCELYYSCIKKNNESYLTQTTEKINTISSSEETNQQVTSVSPIDIFESPDSLNSDKDPSHTREKTIKSSPRPGTDVDNVILELIEKQFSENFRVKFISFLKKGNHFEQIALLENSELIKKAFLANVPKFLESFSSDESYITDREIDEKIYNICTDKKLNAIKILQKIKDEKKTLVPFLFDDEKFKLNFFSLQSLAYVPFMINMNTWFPKLKKVNYFLVNFVEEFGNKTEAEKIFKGKEIFLETHQTLLNTTLEAQNESVKQVMYDQIVHNAKQGCLIKNYDQNIKNCTETQINKVIEFMKEKHIISDNDMRAVYQHIDLMDKFYEAKIIVDTEEALNNLKIKLNVWIPECETFNVKLLEFILNENMSLETIHSLMIKDNFIDHNNQILKRFIESHKKIFEKLIFAKIKKILEKNYKTLGEKHEEMINLLEKSEKNKITDLFFSKHDL